MHTGVLPPGVGGQAAAPSPSEMGTKTLPGPWCSPAWGMLVLPSACAGEPGVPAGCPAAPSMESVFSHPCPPLQYFPGRPCVQTYLQTLDAWLKNWTEPELPRAVLKEAMKNNRDVRCPRGPQAPAPLTPAPCPAAGSACQPHHAVSICPPGLPALRAPHQRDLGGLPGQ